MKRREREREKVYKLDVNAEKDGNRIILSWNFKTDMKPNASTMCLSPVSFFDIEMLCYSGKEYDDSTLWNNVTGLKIFVFAI
jgi:hypothetical protein